jgi:hypothetical protein
MLDLDFVVEVTRITYSVASFMVEHEAEAASTAGMILGGVKYG